MNYFLVATVIISTIFSSCLKKEEAASIVKRPQRSEKSTQPKVRKAKRVSPCSLELLDREGFEPHTLVKDDLNNDGKKDIFFLYGEEDYFNTCIHLKDENEGFKLVHSDHTTYNSVFKFPGHENLQNIVAGPHQLNCGMIEGSLPKLSKDVLKKVKTKYLEWTKGTSKYNFTYNMPDIFPVINLALFQIPSFYRFEKNEKINITEELTIYRDFKIQILKSIIKDQSLKPECKASIEKVLLRIN